MNFITYKSSQDNRISTYKMDQNNDKYKNIKTPRIIGQFDDFQHYVDSVDLLIDSTLETENRTNIIKKFILPQIKQSKMMLDIGIGNGDLTKEFIKYFTKIEAVDLNNKALNNIPDINPYSNIPIAKFNYSILDFPLNKKYDFILFSHTLYYINTENRKRLLKNLYDALNDNGHILLIFNEGGSRGELTKYFGGINFDFTQIIQDLNQLTKNITLIESQENITTNNLNTMLKIANICLKDANATASISQVTDYLINNNNNNIYELDTIQKIILISKSKSSTT